MSYYSKEIKPGAIIDYLEFQIVNTSDGLVLSKRYYNAATELWKCHLGNYSTVMDAKHSAIVHWMISRPAEFHASVFYRFMGSRGSTHDFYTLKESIQKAGYAFPEEITIGGGVSGTIYFNGVPISDYWKSLKNG